MAKSNQKLEDAMQLDYDAVNASSHKHDVKQFHTQHSVQCMKGTAHKRMQTHTYTQMYLRTVNMTTK